MSRARIRIRWGVWVVAATGLLASAVGAQGVLSDSIARYEVTHGGRSERLDIVRTSRRVEHRYLTRGISEVWSRDARGELSHWKVFHQAKRSVHYTAGDLRTIEAEPLWEQLATLINPNERAKFKVGGAKRTVHGQATVLVGEISHLQARVLWNETAGWAEEVTMGAGDKRKKFRLLSSDACSATTCAPFDTSSVREIEFADLGDMERDPFVRTFLSAFAGAHHPH